MADTCTVLIASGERLAALRTEADNGDLVAFPPSEALRALATITERRPEIVALDRPFASTSRGVALIDRIKADPDLARTEIRILPGATTLDPAIRTGASPAIATDQESTGTLDQLDHGTRQMPRARFVPPISVLLDGNDARLVDLSASGAQVLSVTVLRPNQRIRVSLADESGVIRFGAVIAWASFEVPAGTAPRYRAGLAFLDADRYVLEAYCRKYGQS